jgi:phosphatidylserine/phosphatidylglycerophosphate/cardiolipin synthase-like enzyme
MIELLNRNWSKSLSNIFAEAKDEIFISSPYATKDGSTFFLKNTSKEFRQNGKLVFLTNLSPQNISQGSTDPKAFDILQKEIKNISIWHLPNLHAKVYICDKSKAIITSGNFTAGGFYNNFEYGIKVLDSKYSHLIYNDIFSYSQLGSNITQETLKIYLEISEQIKESVKEQQKEIKTSVANKFKALFQEAENQLIKERLNIGPIHSIFSKTILYVLGKYGALSTEELHIYVKQIHPDLCDDSIDRVIDGRHFGKKWKHYVRNSQQHLKRNGLIKLENGIWKLTF